jgi:ribosomal protein L7/L12
MVALENGRLIEAIKHPREATGSGLKNSKEQFERHLANNP